MKLHGIRTAGLPSSVSRSAGLDPNMGFHADASSQPATDTPDGLGGAGRAAAATA
ncbi:hypothetical protein HQ576_04935 [bacterium]|nr:hypothetical protein [bacterium]